MVKRYSQYKLTSIDWVNEIPSEWKEVKVKRLVNPKKYYQIGDGDHGSIKPSMYTDVGVPYIRVQNLTWNGEPSLDSVVFISEEVHKANSKSKLLPYDILIAKTGATVGKLALLNDEYDEYNTTSSVGKLSVDQSENAPKFYIYYFQSLPFKELVWVTSIQKSAQPGFNIDDLTEFKVVQPSLTEQSQIVSYLDRKTALIDSLIEKTERKIALLKEKRTALINQAVTKGLDTNVKMKDSGVEWIGEIPEHWSFLPIKYLTQATKDSIRTGPFGSAIKTTDYLNEGVRVYNQRAVYDEDFSKSDIFVSKEKAKELESFKVRPGDVLITSRGTIGKMTIVPQDGEEGVLHPCLIRLRLTKLIEGRFLWYYMNQSSLFLETVLSESDSTTIEVIYSDTLSNSRIAIPPVEEQKEIVDFLEERVGKIDAYIAGELSRVEFLKEYRQALISEVVTGKIKVTEDV